jgi:hypothetical protein
MLCIQVEPPFETEQIIELPYQGQTWQADTSAKTLAWGGFDESVLVHVSTFRTYILILKMYGLQALLLLRTLYLI